MGDSILDMISDQLSSIQEEQKKQAELRGQITAHLTYHQSEHVNIQATLVAINGRLEALENRLQVRDAQDIRDQARKEGVSWTWHAIASAAAGIAAFIAWLAGLPKQIWDYLTGGS